MDSHSERDELKALQREAAKLPEKGTNSPPSGGEKTERPESEETIAEAQTTESEKAAPDLAAQIERAVREMEATAREHPTLALLATFGSARARVHGRHRYGHAPLLPPNRLVRLGRPDVRSSPPGLPGDSGLRRDPVLGRERRIPTSQHADAKGMG